MKKIFLCILTVVAVMTMASCSYQVNEVMQPVVRGNLQFVVSDLPAFGEAQTGAVTPLNMSLTDLKTDTPKIVTLASPKAGRLLTTNCRFPRTAGCITSFTW